MDNVVLSVLAHPDDAEFLCAGTLIRLVVEHGWRAHIASMTAGDCGSMEFVPERSPPFAARKGPGRRSGSGQHITAWKNSTCASSMPMGHWSA